MQLQERWEMELRFASDAARRIAGIVAGGVLVGALAAGCSTVAGGVQPTATAAAAPVRLAVQADTVLGSKGLPKGLGFCVPQNQFSRGESVVWRVRVIDPVTGKDMDASSLASVQVKLPDKSIDLHFADHPKTNPVDHFWAASFDIPTDYPTGQLPYSVVATAKDGRTGTFEQFKVSLAMLQVVAAPIPSAPPVTQ
jgi:hypothetical protein